MKTTVIILAFFLASCNDNNDKITDLELRILDLELKNESLEILIYTKEMESIKRDKGHQDLMLEHLKYQHNIK